MYKDGHCGVQTRHARHIYGPDQTALGGLWYMCPGHLEGQEPVIFPEPASIPQEAVDAYLRTLGLKREELTDDAFAKVHEVISEVLKALIELQYCVHD